MLSCNTKTAAADAGGCAIMTAQTLCVACHPHISGCVDATVRLAVARGTITTVWSCVPPSHLTHTPLPESVCAHEGLVVCTQIEAVQQYNRLHDGVAPKPFDCQYITPVDEIHHPHCAAWLRPSRVSWVL